jgi:hypothetical protein
MRARAVRGAEKRAEGQATAGLRAPASGPAQQAPADALNSWLPGWVGKQATERSAGPLNRHRSAAPCPPPRRVFRRICHSDTGTQTQRSAPNTIRGPEVPTVPRTTFGQRISLVPFMPSHVITGTSTHIRAPRSFPVGRLHGTPADGTSPRNHAPGTRRPTP